MDSDSMRNFFFSNQADFNSNSDQVGSHASFANNGGPTIDQNESSGGYPLLLRQYLSQQQQHQHQQQSLLQQQDFSSPQYGAGQIFDNSMGFATMQGQMNMNQSFASYGNTGMQQSVRNNYGNLPQTVAATPSTSQSDLSASDRMFSLSGMNALSNATFMANPLPTQSTASFMNASNNNLVNRDPYAEQGILGPWSERSAGLLGKLVCMNPADTQGRVKRARRKQPKDKPKRPLSAYNIFFKEERARLLSKGPSEQIGSGDHKRTANGKIGFESLAKIIGGKWQDLEPTEVEYYKEKAAADMKRYKGEMEEYNKKTADKIKIDEEEEGDDVSGDSKRQRYE